MDKNTNFVGLIENICIDLSTVFEQMKTVPGMYDGTVERYHALCAAIPQQLKEGVIKIAVVGAIKSGKSTFINSLLMNDLLKRGAGVVTSVVTRVRRGKVLRAQILFKSWDEINHEIEKALILIPGEPEAFGMSGNSSGLNPRGFDLRRKSDRKFLETIRTRLCFGAYSEKTYENSLVENGLRPESIVVANALDGYDHVKDLVQTDSCYSDSCPVEFTGERFIEHKKFTGVGCNAFFVKDVLIEVPLSARFNLCKDSFSVLEAMVEIADCQGSDSIDPSHMAHIQDYLLSANMLVYVISSRTALRDADFKFLNIIQKMGIINNIFFVLNADFNEHESLESLTELENSVKQGLGYFVQNPVVYTVSSLFNLFSALEKGVTAIEADLPANDLPDNGHALMGITKNESLMIANISKDFYIKSHGTNNSNVMNDTTSCEAVQNFQFINYVSEADFCTKYKKDLSDKELLRFRQWQQETELVEYTARRNEELQLALQQKIKTEQFSTMLENHVERLRIVIQGAGKRNSMFMALLSDNLNRVIDAAKQLKQLQEQSRRLESFIDDSIQNSVDGIKRNISASIKLFFDKRRGIQAMNVKDFIFGFPIYNDRYEEMIAIVGFNHTLYRMFQDFRTELDLFMSQQFNPAVIELIHEQEQHIEKEFQNLYQSCYTAPSKIYQQSGGVVCRQPGGAIYQQSDRVDHSSLEHASSYSVPFQPDKLRLLSSQEPFPLMAVDLNSTRRILGLSLPKSGFATSYSAKLRFDAMARFSFYSLMEFLGKFISSLAPGKPKSRALRESAKQIRKESLQSVMLHFDSYQHHVETEYLFPLVQAVARDFRDKIIDMFRMCEVESEHIKTLVSDEQIDKHDKLEHVKAIGSATQEIADRINEIYIKAIS
ncbi:MAG: dynamin family protein [Desulfamplus sp.]|nr:dynamin family protein [Desulfamplus sp.]